jgi:hypothetical protein
MTAQNDTGFSSFTSSFNRRSLLDSSLSVGQTRARDRNFNIGTRSSFERSERIRGRNRNDIYRFELKRSSQVFISVRNRDLFFSDSIKIRVQRRGSSSRIERTAFPGGVALIERRFSSGTYTLRLSSREDVRYRLVYRRRTDRVDLFS